MDLKQPKDFLLLEALHSYGRNVAPNLARMVDVDVDEVDERLRSLSEYELVSKIGPAEESGLFEVTERGRIALRLRDEYGSIEDFDGLIDNHFSAHETAAPTAIVRGKRKRD